MYIVRSQISQQLQKYSRSFAAISSNSPPPSLNTVGPYQVFDRNSKEYNVIVLLFAMEDRKAE